MKERPILFNGEMVRAILDGSKTQTRRVINPQPVPMGVSSYGGTRQGWNWKRETFNRSWNDDDKAPYRKACLATMALACVCPYGQTGDRLYVRETWRKNLSGKIWYRADGKSVADGLWKPGIHMPRILSRITLEIESVRVERVQQITHFDAFLEGAESKPSWITGPYCQSHVEGFRQLWDSINLKRGFGWESNPWLWVITFRRVQ